MGCATMFYTKAPYHLQALIYLGLGKMAAIFQMTTLINFHKLDLPLD